MGLRSVIVQIWAVAELVLTRLPTVHWQLPAESATPDGRERYPDLTKALTLHLRDVGDCLEEDRLESARAAMRWARAIEEELDDIGDTPDEDPVHPRSVDRED